MSSPSSTAASTNDTATVIAVGTLAATLAAIGHETVGHGLGCVGTGGHITLLTSIWFHCHGGSAITDAGGPAANIVAGAAAFALLNWTRLKPRMNLFLLLLGTLNSFWFMTQLAFNALRNTDDWHYTALQLGWPPIWRTVVAVVGLGGYLLVSRLVSVVIRRQGGPQVNAIRLAYAAAAASAVIAGLMWRPEPLRSALEGFLALGVAPLGLLSAGRTVSQDGVHDDSSRSVQRSWIWISVGLVLFLVFLFVQARGLGSMAHDSRSVLPDSSPTASASQADTGNTKLHQGGAQMVNIPYSK
jgi:hypothetical protein